MSRHAPAGTSALTLAVLTALVTAGCGGAAKAEELVSGWSVDLIEAPAGEARSCAATKMTGTDRGIGFTQLASGMEFLTVAVEGWSYPVGDELFEQLKIGEGAPYELKAFGQNNATLASGKFSTDPALKRAKTLEVAIGDKHATFDVDGLDKAFEALRTCVLPKV